MDLSAIYVLSGKPNRELIHAFISQKDEEFSYSEVGCSRQKPPTGYTVDHNRVTLGQGANAVPAIQRGQGQHVRELAARYNNAVSRSRRRDPLLLLLAVR
jgi:uncharacterized protein (UPF0548 family)